MATYYSYPSTTGGVWYNWVSTSATSTCTTSTSDTVWVNWIGTGSTSTNITSVSNNTTQTVWCQWIDGMGRVVSQPLPAGGVLRQAAEANQEQIRQQQEQAAERAKTQKAIAEKAMQLLRENLSKKQQAALDKHGWFLVEGGKSKKTYRIYGDRVAGNIHELDAEQKKEIARYCVHAEYSIPLGDQLLAQAICLALDEEYIIGKANKTQLAA